MRRGFKTCLPSSAAGPPSQGRGTPHTAFQMLQIAGSRTWSLWWRACRPIPDPPRARILHQLTCSEEEKQSLFKRNLHVGIRYLSEINKTQDWFGSLVCITVCLTRKEEPGMAKDCLYRYALQKSNRT